MMDLRSLLRTLAICRPLFHSEADFQHAFAWELHRQFPEGTIRLELPMNSALGLLHVDVTAQLEGRAHAFELKYKTRATVACVGSEVYALQNHGAQPLGRYDFLKDVARLESVAEALSGLAACAILLTNDSAYWSAPRSGDETSAAFSLSDGRSLSGHLDWSPETSPGTKRKREAPIDLKGKYVLRWQDYSDIGSRYCARFRFIAIEVRPVSATAKQP